MNDVCRFSSDHVVECSERTVLSCLEPVCLGWQRFGRGTSEQLKRIFLPHHTLNDVELIPLLKLRNSRNSYRYTMEQHFISTAGTLKIGVNRTSDH